MIIASVIFSIFFALLFTTLLILAFKRRGPGPLDGALFLFLIIFMFTWAVGSWLVPVGPVHWGVSWLGYLLVAFVLMLLLGALMPPSRPRNRMIRKLELESEIREDETSQALEITFGIFFWFMIISLIVIVILKIIR